MLSFGCGDLPSLNQPLRNTILDNSSLAIACLLVGCIPMMWGRLSQIRSSSKYRSIGDLFMDRELPPGPSHPPPREPVDALRLLVQDLRSKGHSAVGLPELDAYLAQLPMPPNEDALAQWQTNATLEHAGALEMFKSTLEAGQTALKILLSVNGGAAVALLAFLGTLQGKASLPGAVPTRAIADAMAFFIGGVGFSALAAAARYLVQFFGMRHLHLARGQKTSAWLKAGLTFNIVSVLAGLGSMAGFFIGGWLAYKALR